MDEAFVHAEYQAQPAEQMDKQRAQLIDDIENADELVEAALSTLDDPEVVQALVEASQSGVDVRIVGDWDRREAAGFKTLENNDVFPVFGDGELNYLPEPTLSSVLGQCRMFEDEQYKVCFSGNEQGTMVRPGNFNIMSHDFFIIDERTVWTTPPLDGQGRDWVGWRIESSKLAYDYGREFQQMHGGVFASTLDVYNGPVKSTNDYNIRYHTDKGQMKVWFNPQERLLKQVIDQLYKAKSSVWIMSDNLTNPFLLDALEYKNDNGFDVRLLINPDTQATGEPKSRLEALGVRWAADRYDHLPTVILLDSEPDRTGRPRPRSVLGLSHALLRGSPFEVDYKDEVDDEVIIYPADLFVDGNLWQLEESGANIHGDPQLEQFEQYWLGAWKASE